MGASSSNYPGEYDLAPPLVDGARVDGGGMNEAVDRFNLLRNAIRKIQLELGTNPQGSAASVKARLDVRQASSGVTRGLVHLHQAGVSANVAEGNRTSFLVAQATATRSSGSSGLYFVNIPSQYASDPPDRVFCRHEIQWSSITGNSFFWRTCYVDQSTISGTGFQITAYQGDDFNGSIASTLVTATWTPMTTASFTVRIMLLGGGGSTAKALEAQYLVGEEVGTGYILTQTSEQIEMQDSPA